MGYVAQWFIRENKQYKRNFKIGEQNIVTRVNINQIRIIKKKLKWKRLNEKKMV